MFPKNKQNKLRQMKKNEIQQQSYLNYTTIIKYAVCFLIFYFSSDKLAKTQHFMQNAEFFSFLANALQSKMLFEGKLTNLINNRDDVEDIAGNNNTDHDQVLFELQKTILDILEDIMNVQTYADDNFLAIMYNNKWYPDKEIVVRRIA